MDLIISTDKEKLDINAIHNFISNESYWGKGRTIEEMRTAIDHSLCFGMYLKSGEQVGFARVLTDYVVFAYFMDIVIFKAHQRKGFGRELLNFIMDHEGLRHVKTRALKTRDAQALYQNYGFRSIGNSSLWMSKDEVVLS